jgi:hypothetical protein
VDGRHRPAPDRVQRHYDDFQLKAEDAAYFKKLVAERGLALVIGEDWCPDVWRGLP